MGLGRWPDRGWRPSRCGPPAPIRRTLSQLATQASRRLLLLRAVVLSCHIRSEMDATCGRCGAQAATFSFPGERDDQGDCCADCHIVTVTRGLELARATEASKFRKLKILFGDWWPHYTPPRELRYTLYFERRSCPYCGAELGPATRRGPMTTSHSRVMPTSITWIRSIEGGTTPGGTPSTAAGAAISRREG